MRDTSAFVIRGLLMLLFAVMCQFLPIFLFMLYEHIVAFKNMEVEKVFFRLQIFFFPPLTIPCVYFFLSKYLSGKKLLIGIFTSLLLSLCHSYVLFAIAHNPREYLYLFPTTPSAYIGEIAEAEVYMRVIIYSVFANLTFIFYTCSMVFFTKLPTNFFKGGILISLFLGISLILILHYANANLFFFYGIFGTTLAIIAIMAYSLLIMCTNKKAQNK